MAGLKFHNNVAVATIQFHCLYAGQAGFTGTRIDQKHCIACKIKRRLYPGAGVKWNVRFTGVVIVQAFGPVT